MCNKNVKTGRHIMLGMTVAACLFSGMNIKAYAGEKNKLPSAGIDFILSSDAVSVKNLQDEKPVNNGQSSENESQSSATATLLPTSTIFPAASATMFITATPGSDELIPVPSVEQIPEEPAVEEKLIEETVVATTTKTVNEKERELANKREEEGFKSLVIARVNHYVNVRSMPSEEGEIVGKLYDKSVGEFLSEQDGWYEITSGSVTGYVKGEYCVTGEEAVEYAREVGTRIATVTTTTLKVRENPSLDAAVLGLVPIQDELLVTNELDDWVEVNIEEGNGYVSLDYVTLSTEFVKAESRAEEEARLEKERAEREAALAAARKVNAARGSVSSSSEKSETNYAPADTSGSGSELGRAVANFACQFVGNPYVYGGTSLTNGADCSGFVMSVYNNFGVSLPHSSAADRSVGAAVDGIENAQPGDILCYSGHVGIYIGNGQIVHASTSKTGIIISNARYRSILSVRRIF